MYLRSRASPHYSSCLLPFFNPIETFIAHFKARMRRVYQEGTLTAKTLPIKVLEIMKTFSKTNLDKIYAKCGYEIGGAFELRAFRPDLEAGDERTDLFYSSG
ncbi:hypothetical protein BC828DRAFT_36549 [Blastocladiella britannica]|nr:hypothetical protein BC828DRAFT_36549 [Blastocladiella britannica]